MTNPSDGIDDNSWCSSFKSVKLFSEGIAPQIFCTVSDAAFVIFVIIPLKTIQGHDLIKQ